MEEKEEDNEDDIIDGFAEYSPKSEFSKPKIVFDASERCMQLRAKEMKKGYFNTTVSKEGLPIRTWVEDSRKSYCSAVAALASLLIPEIIEDEGYEEQKKKFDEKHKGDKDKKYKNPIDKIKLKIEECFKKYAYYPLEPKKDKEGKITYKKGEKYFMPEVDAMVQIRKIYPDSSEELIDSAKFWNKYINAYWNEMVVLNDNLFEELIRVIHRLNYFKSSGGFGNWNK